MADPGETPAARVEITPLENRMPPDPQEIKALLDRPLLARLATANPASGQPHVVPVWYAWDGESLWISAFDSTRKVKDLRRNAKCAVVIDVDGPADGLRGVLMEGEAELVKQPADLMRRQTTWIYARYLGDEGVLAAEPQSWIDDPENTLIRLTPRQVYGWK